MNKLILDLDLGRQNNSQYSAKLLCVFVCRRSPPKSNYLDIAIVAHTISWIMPCPSLFL